MKYLLMLLTLITGALLPVQAILNTRLGRQTGGPLMGSLLSFIVGLMALFLLNLATNYSAVVQLKPNRYRSLVYMAGGLLGPSLSGILPG